MTTQLSARVIPARVHARDWSWRHAGRELPAVHGLTVEIEPGQKVLLIGPSGAGKSTLLHAMAGVLHPDEDNASTGSLEINGIPAYGQRGVAGLMQQDPETQVILSRVGDDVAFGAENLAVPREEIWPRVSAALEAVGLDVSLDHSTARLSGGQKQRLALAGILAMRPGLLLLDEPTANLDPDGVLEVRDAVLASIADSGATAIVVEHRIAEWARHMDRVLVLQPHGGISHDVHPERLWSDADLRRALAAAGVWVPDFEYDDARSPCEGTAEDSRVLLSARGLAVSKEAPHRRTFWGRRSREEGSRKSAPSPVLTGIDLELREGEAVSVIGKNGAGKSTLLLTLAGLLEKHRGELEASTELRGHLENSDPFSWRAPELVTRVGTVFQEPEHQFVTPSVREELAFGPRHAVHPETGQPLFTEEEAQERVNQLLARLHLSHLANANPFTLSGGEKRRLSVATVLAAGPRVLLLDEPTFGQDANTWAELVALLREQLAAGTSLVAVTHDDAFTRALSAATFRVGEHPTGERPTGEQPNEEHPSGGSL